MNSGCTKNGATPGERVFGGFPGGHCTFVQAGCGRERVPFDTVGLISLKAIGARCNFQLCNQ